MKKSFFSIRYILNIFFILSACFLLLHCQSSSTQNKPEQSDRELMVSRQIEARGIKDPKVLAAMRKVERHLFVPQVYENQAYSDRPLPIGYGQTISQPYIVAFMTEILDLKKDDKVLEVGTGSGYQAAILAEICDTVYTIEIVEELGKHAAALLKKLGYKNIKVKVGDGYKGWPEHAPFDAIIVTCAPTHVPQNLQDQLKEGGKIIVPVGDRGSQKLVLLTKRKGKIVKKDIIPVRFVPMVNEEGNLY